MREKRASEGGGQGRKGMERTSIIPTTSPGIGDGSYIDPLMPPIIIVPGLLGVGDGGAKF